MKTLILFCISIFFYNTLFSQNVGIGTTAPKTNLHIAEDHSVLFGKDTIGGGAKMMWLPDLGAFRAGTLDDGASSTYWNIDSIGLHSFASGYKTRAQGFGATAMGRGAIASGESSTAIGRGAIASGESSTAMGSSTIARGYASTAMGQSTEASGNYSFAIGRYAIASGRVSTAMGSYTSASGQRSTAMGHETKAESYSSTAIGSYNIGGGDPVNWVNDDPIFEIGIGIAQTGTRNNALTVLKNGKHGIMTSAPKANLHIKDDGTLGSGTIVAVLESNTSNRPILQFSETANGDANSGMSIEYDGSGSGSDNKMYINNTNGSPIVDFESNGEVGIGTIAPKANLHVKDDGTSGSGTIVAILESNVSDRPILQFSETPIGDADSGMSIEYNGSGSGDNNKLHFNKTNGLPAMTIDNGGQVGIGVSSPTFALHLPDNSSTGKARAHSWTTYSDERIKSDEHNLSYGLREIMLLKPLSYKQHDASFVHSELQVSAESENTIGFFAQEVHKVIPEAAIKPENENEQLWGMEYEKLIPVLVKGMQEQQAEIELLKEEIKKLTNKKENQQSATVQNQSSLYTKPDNKK